MWKKWLVFSVVFVMLFSLSVGCSTDNNNSGADSSNQKETETIKVVTWYSEELADWSKVVGAFEEKHPDINVEIVIFAENNSFENAQKVDLAAASGEEMDVIMLDEPKPYAVRVGMGMFEPLDEYLAKEKVDVKSEYGLDTQINGKYYALPGKFIQWFVLLNKNHLDEANLPVPKDWTWDEFLDYAKQLTKGEGADKRYGTYFHSWPQYFQLALLNQTNQSNNSILTADGKSNIASADFRKSLEIRVQAQDEGSALPFGDGIAQKAHYRPQFFNESVSMIVTGSWMVQEMGGTETLPATFPIAVAPYPKNNKGDKIASRMEGDYLGIYSKSKHKESAYKFIRWFTTEGIVLQGKELPSVKNIDLEETVDKILANTPNPEFADKESLLYVLDQTNPAKFMPPTFIGEAEDAVAAEFEKLMLGKQSIDETISNSEKLVQAVVKENQ